MRVVLAVLLMLAAAPAWAEWVEFGSTAEGVQYVDPGTIRKDGGLRSVWALIDLIARGKIGELSRRAQWEFDCERQRFRLLAFSSHSGPMATEKLLSGGKGPPGWNEPSPGTVNDLMLE